MVQEVMAMKEYSTFTKVPGQDPHDQIQFSDISRYSVVVVVVVVGFCWSVVGVFNDPRS